MTWSIVAKDPATGHFGVAVASRFFAVGALVPQVRGGVGAIATQAFVSPLYGTRGMDLLRAGASAEEVLAKVTEGDAGSASRQLHVIDAAGRNVAFTGANCVDWAGHLVEDGVSVAGNMLAGPEVVERTMAVYQACLDMPFPERMMTAMEAGEAAGGDKRGKQSAALVIHRQEAYPWLSIRADDHTDPLAELRRLYAVAGERALIFAEAMPTEANPSGMTDRRPLDARMAEEERRRREAGIKSASFATPLPPTR